MFGCKILNPAFITKYEQEESQKIENKTKKGIISEIKLLLVEMPTKETAIEMEFNLSKKEESLKHQELIELYYSVLNINEH